MADNEHAATANNNLMKDEFCHKKQRIVVAGSVCQRFAIIKAIARNSYEIVEADAAADLLTMLSEHEYDLVITSTDLPGHNSVELMQSIFKIGKSFAVLAQSDTDAEIDRVLALELGADDCVPMSCGSRELNARVHALLRRRSRNSTNVIKTSSKGANMVGSELSHHGWVVNRDRRQLYSPNGNVIPVSNVEYCVLVGLFTNPGSIKDRSSLRDCNDGSAESDLRSIDVSISRIRKKMSRYSSQDIIETVHGVGYRLIKDGPRSE
jgi:DNA-binding response OmpR family regulator